MRLHKEFPLTPRARVNLLLPHLVYADIYGGIITAALVAIKFKMRHPEVDLRVVLTDGPGDSAILKNAIERYFAESLDSVTIPVIEMYDRKRQSLSVHEDDIFLATAWWTCYPAQAATQKNKKFLYLIQDFEPGFYPWGKDYAGALATYSMNFVPIFNTSILREFFVKQSLIRKEVAFQGATFEPAINPLILQARKNRPIKKEKKRLFFYGRQSVARNLFGIGIIALENVINEELFAIDEWEFISAGETHDPIALGQGAVLKSAGKMSMEDYANFLANTDIGLSLMLSPHPSYPPLEIAAAGAICVTNTYENKDLSLLHHNIISCAPSVSGIVSGLKQAIARLDSPQLVVPVNQLETNWDESLKDTLALIANFSKTNLSHKLPENNFGTQAARRTLQQ